MDRLESSAARLTSKDEQGRYVPPTISSLREEDVLEQVGPAQAYAGNLPFAF